MPSIYWARFHYSSLVVGTRWNTPTSLIHWTPFLIWEIRIAMRKEAKTWGKNAKMSKPQIQFLLLSIHQQSKTHPQPQDSPGTIPAESQRVQGSEKVPAHLSGRVQEQQLLQLILQKIVIKIADVVKVMRRNLQLAFIDGVGINLCNKGQKVIAICTVLL